MTTEPKCPACNAPWTKHLGCEGLCREVQQYREILSWLEAGGRYEREGDHWFAYSGRLVGCRGASLMQAIRNAIEAAKDDEGSNG